MSVVEAEVGSSEAVTRGIRVMVEARYAPDYSHPHQGLWFFFYTVTLLNEGEQTAQLLRRHWVITDGEGRTEDVEGPGVVGEQPVLEPGQSFQYTSGCPLRTPLGSMHGTYLMQTPSGERFDARVAPFPLNGPYTVN